MPRTDFDPLSERECYAVQLLGRGKQAKEVAEALEVEFTTARTFIARAYLKLRVDNKIDAVVRHKSVHSFCGMRTSRRP